MFSKKCQAHLNDVNMTRWQHFKFAWWFLWQLKKAGIALAIHSVAPRFLQTYASDKILELAEILKDHKK